MERMSNKDYREHEGISSSELKLLHKSPLHYKYWSEHKEEKDSPSLAFGRAAHKYFLETYDFDKEFIVAPDVDRRSKEGKEKYLKFLEDSKGKDVITQEQFEQIVEMRKALLSTKFVEKLINGEHEVSLFAVDDETGLKVKCRPDSIGEVAGTPVIVDYKTTQSADPDKFMGECMRYLYDLQLAMYKEIADKVTGKDHVVIFIAQEKTAPYAVNIFQADDIFLKSGSELYHEMLRTFKYCKDTDDWYGLMGKEQEIYSLGIPKWMQTKLESEE